MQDSTVETLSEFSVYFDRSPFMWGIVGKMVEKCDFHQVENVGFHQLWTHLIICILDRYN